MEITDKNLDAHTGNLSKNDWIEVERRGNWHRSYSTAFYKNYLSTENIEDIQFSEHYAPCAENMGMKFIVDDFIKQRKFKITNLVNIGDDADYAPTFENIEYKSGKHKSCLRNGTYLLTLNKIKYALIVAPMSEGFGQFVVVSVKGSTPSSEKLLEELRAYASKHNYLKGQKITGNLSLIDLTRRYEWNELILDKYTEKELKTNLTNLLDNVDIYKKNNLPLKRGLIISGPPGTGKSLLGKILCHNVDWTFMWITPKHFHNSSAVSNVMKTARMLSPTIIFLEDLDLYGKHRDQNSFTSLLGELMNQLDGIEDNNYVVSIATTNNYESLEKALLDRPGRFDKMITFNTPTHKSREHMFKSFLGKLRLEKDVDMEELVDRTDRFTGAHIKEVVNQAVLQAIDDGSYDKNKILTLKKKHFDDALISAKKKDFAAPLGFTSKNGTNVEAKEEEPQPIEAPGNWPDDTP